jgi:hypothetical protein
LSGWELLISLAYALVITTILAIVSYELSFLARKEKHDYRRFILEHLLADSFNIACGWTWYNMIDVMFKCLAGSSWRSFEAQAIRSIIVIALSAFAYGQIPSDRMESLTVRDSVIYSIMKTTTYLVPTLSVLSVYYYVIYYEYSYPTNFGILMGIAVGITLAVLAGATYAGWEWKTKWQQYLYSVSGWVVTYSFWYP